MFNIYQKVANEVIGRQIEIKVILAALASNRHLFLEGPPGTSKTTILKTVARLADVPFYTITGNNDLTSSKLIGYFDPAHTLSNGYRPEFFEYGVLTRAMIDGAILYVDEFNRIPDETTNVFVTVTSEGEMSIPRLGLIKAVPSFRVVAAMNPYDDTGTNRISRALKDRFCSIRMNYQSREEECAIVARQSEGEPWLVDLAVDISRETRKHPEVRLGASVRGATDMVLIALQLLINGSMDTEQALEFAALAAMRDKIWVSEMSQSTVEDIIKEILNRLWSKSKKKILIKDI